MRDKRCADGEQGHDCSSNTGLEANENGEAADELNQTNQNGGYSWNREAETSEVAGSTGNCCQLGEASENEQDRKKDACDERGRPLL